MKHHLIIWSLALFAGVGLSQATACEAEATSFEAEDGCANYCNVALDCEEDIDHADCVSDCLENLDNCFESERDEAIDELQTCGGNDCGDFADCTQEAALECYFGT